MRERSNVAQLQDDIDERLRAVVIPKVEAHVTAGEPKKFKHTLGVTPSMAFALPMTNCNVWAEEEDQRIWSATDIVLRCDVSSAPLRLVVIE